MFTPPQYQPDYTIGLGVPQPGETQMLKDRRDLAL
jgi:hypothetical protein